MAPHRALSWILAPLLGAASLSACAADCSPAVEGGWVRKPPADLPMLAGYARIANACDREAVVVSASSTDFADVSLHATTIEGGVSRMREVDEVRVGAGRTVAFEPGGMHLMLMQPKRKLRDGDVVAIDFELADGRKLRGRFEVKGPRAVPSR